MKISTILALVLAPMSAPGCATASHGEYTTHWSRPEDIATIPIASGVSLRYVSVGQGPPLVLLHTIRTQLDYFERVIPALRERYRVYVVDLPGHGQSTVLKTQYTEPLFRQAVREFVTQLDLRAVTFVGESIGGVLALTVASELPDRISRVVAINPYDYGEKYGGGVRRGNASWIIGLFHVFGRLTIEPKGLLRKVFESGFSDPSKLPEPIFTEFYRTGKRSGYRRAEASVWKNWRTWIEARALYPRVAAPVTLVYSSRDWSRAEDRERTHRAIPNAERIAIDNAGHFASLEDPQAVVRAILGNSGSAGSERTVRSRPFGCISSNSRCDNQAGLDPVHAAPQVMFAGEKRLSTVGVVSPTKAHTQGFITSSVETQARCEPLDVSPAQEEKCRHE